MLGEATSFDSWEGVAWFLGGSAVRGAVVLAAALLIHGALRKASAGSRHVMMVAAVVGVLLIPMATLVAPSISVAILPQSVQSQVAEAASVQAADAPPPSLSPNLRSVPRGTLAPSDVGAASQPALASGYADEPAGFSLSWQAMVVLVWALGAFVVLLPTLAGLWNVTRKALRAQLVNDTEWLILLNEAREDLGVRRSVRLLQSDEPEIPTTWGLFRSVVLLPSDAVRWPEERRRIVLLHELAHIKRHDYATQLIAYVVRALHWFNPLAWLSVRALRMDSERACDDLLVAAGSKPSEYARHLIDMVRTLRPASSAAFVAIAMARRSRLERRVRAILDKRMRRGAVTRRMLVAALTLALALSGIVAAVQPVAHVLAEEGNGTARATFPCGAVVELTAVRKHLSEDERFWRPNGTPMEERVYNTSSSKVGLAEGFEAYEISLVASNLPEGIRLRSVSFPGSGGGARGCSEKQNWRDDLALRIETVGYPVGAKTATVRARIPDCRWEPFDGGTFAGESGTMATQDAFVAYGERYVKDGELRITVTDNMADRYARLVAIDEAGKEHPVFMKSSTGSEPTIRMGTYCIADLDEEETWQCTAFRFETCGYETVEFRNVSLVPGHRTAVAVASEAMLSMGNSQGQVDGRRTERGGRLGTSSKRTPQSAANHLRRLGLAFKMFANESKGELFPPKSAEDSVFLPESSGDWDGHVIGVPEGLEAKAYLEGQRGVDLCYFGHVVKEEAEAMALLDAYAQEGVERIRNADITVTCPERPGQPFQIHRIREGIERFLITDINDPAGSARAQSELPILWELPDSEEREGKGGYVLYMDGHVEWIDYPGRFPMSEALVKRIRAIRGREREERKRKTREVEVTIHENFGRRSRVGRGELERGREAAPAPVSLLIIKKWPDGSLRAGIKTDELRYYKEGDQFEGYRLAKIELEKESVYLQQDDPEKVIKLRYGEEHERYVEEVRRQAGVRRAEEHLKRTAETTGAVCEIFKEKA